MIFISPNVLLFSIQTPFMTQTVKDHALEYLPNEEANDIESKLWWMVGRKKIIRAYLDFLILSKKDLRLMDVGCGSGGNFDVLSEYGEVYGVEPSPILAQRAREKSYVKEVYEEDVNTLHNLSNMDIFTLFDVLEHIEDDVTFLKQIYQKAENNSKLLISVPACPFLFSQHDVLLHHYRRYNVPMIRKLVEQSGYTLTSVSYHMTFLFPLALLLRISEKIKSLLGKPSEAIEIGKTGPFANYMLTKILSAEAFFVQKTKLPIGLWLFATAEKK